MGKSTHMMKTETSYLADRPDMAKESNGSVMDSDQTPIVSRGEGN
jgi:hypothetical protein